MGTSREHTGILGDQSVHHQDDDGRLTGVSRGEQSLLGDKRIETTLADGSVAISRECRPLLGQPFTETVYPDGSRAETRDCKDCFGNAFRETRRADGSVIRHDTTTNFFGETLVKSRQTRPPDKRKKTPATEPDEADSPAESDWTVVLLKLGFFLAVAAVVILAVLYSLPFWLGGMVVGWISGFAMAAVRALSLGGEALRSAPVFTLPGTRGKMEVGGDFVTSAQRLFPERLVPALLVICWAGLLAVPLLHVANEVPWVPVAVPVAALVSLVMGCLWAAKGFRRGLKWAVRRAQHLPGGGDAGWAGTGVLLSLVLLLVLTFMGKGLPDSLRRDYGTQRGPAPLLRR